MTDPRDTEARLREIETSWYEFKAPSIDYGSVAIPKESVIWLLSLVREQRAIVALAKERLGPAGYKVLERYQEQQARIVELQKEALTAAPGEKGSK